MTRPEFDRRLLVAVVWITAGLAVLPLATGRPFAVTRVAALLALLTLPGLAVHLLLDRRPALLPLALSSLAISPVLVGCLGALMMLAGFSPATAAHTIIALAGLAAAAAAAAARGVPTDGPVRGRTGAVVLAGTLAVFCIAAGSLPLGHEAWRYWSDAWFHGAVVAQIDTYGIPPEDPYFAGLPLQYMWLYHVLIIVLSEGADIDPMLVMPLINLQALVGFGLAAFLLSSVLRKRFAFGWFALVVVILGLNALAWVFLPLKLVKAFVGEVRGWDEVVRSFSLVPFNEATAAKYLTVYFNQTFLLKKFVVSTAFSLGLFYMAVSWYAGIRYLSAAKGSALGLAFFAVLGMLVFHSLVGFILLGSLFVALAVLVLGRRGLRDFSWGRVAALVLAVSLAGAVAAPYLYDIMHLKESEQFLPLGLSLRKSGGILVSCALVILLAGFQLKRLYTERSMAARMLFLGALSVFVVCNIIGLPGSNTFDKLPIFVFYPLAIIGSWTIADRFSRRHALAKSRLKVAVLALLVLLPVNTFAMLAYYRSPPEPRVTPDEKRISLWAQRETSRDAIFFDSNDRVFLLVTGPRRYYWGTASYAEQWGYPKSEISKRRHVRDNLYSDDALDRVTLTTLGSLETEVYILARGGEEPAPARFASHPQLFEEAFRAGAIVVFKVDRAACIETARSLARNDGPR